MCKQTHTKTCPNNPQAKSKPQQDLIVEFVFADLKPNVSCIRLRQHDTVKIVTNRLYEQQELNE